MRRRRLVDALIFLIKFNLLAIPLYILLYLNFSYQPLQNLVAFLSYKTLKMLGIQVSLSGSLLTVVEGFKISLVEISMDCTGWKSLYALAALTIATPGFKTKRKAIFLILALPFVFFVNIFRIAITSYLSLVLEPVSFGLFHDIFWQWGLILAVLGVWVLWLKYEKRI